MQRLFQDEEICFIGDDLIDIAVLTRVGFSVTVSGAPDEVSAVAHYVTVNKGGSGAVREVIEIVLKAQGACEDLVQGLSSV